MQRAWLRSTHETNRSTERLRDSGHFVEHLFDVGILLIDEEMLSVCTIASTKRAKNVRIAELVDFVLKVLVVENPAISLSEAQRAA